MTADRDRWDTRWARATGALGPPHPLLSALVAELPSGASVLDVAAGRGRQARALSAAGLAVTAVDVSSVGLRQLAAHAPGPVHTVVHDLTLGLPSGLGGFAAVVCVDYRRPELWPALRSALAPGGHLLVSLATPTNLERHARPSARFLAGADDADRLAEGLDVRHRSAAWRASGRHELWVWAIRA